jgi:acetyl esterase
MMTELDPKLRVLLDMMAALGRPPLSETTPQQFRAMRAASRDILNAPVAPLAIIREETVAGAGGPLKARLYDTADGEARPTLVYFHGGGFVFGDLESHDALCRRLALAGNIRVIAVDYRLAPEHPFPAAIEDTEAAFLDIAKRHRHFGADAKRLAVGGDSAGANLATVTARRAAKAGGPAPLFQLLFYPVTQSVETTPSREQFADGYFLTRETMDWFDNHYLPPSADRLDERISPLLTPPPGNLAPALVITAGYDPLKDEGRMYAEALRDAGIPCRYVDYESQIHGFASFTAFSSVADEAIADAARTVRDALA